MNMIVASKRRKMLTAKGKVREDLDHYEVIREKMYVTKDYFDSVNASTYQNGVFMVEDEEATKERNEMAKKIYQKRIEKDEVSKLAAKAKLTDILGLEGEEKPKRGRKPKEVIN